MLCDTDAVVCAFWLIELANMKPTMNPSSIPMTPKSKFSLDIDYLLPASDFAWLIFAVINSAASVSDSTFFSTRSQYAIAFL